MEKYGNLAKNRIRIKKWNFLQIIKIENNFRDIGGKTEKLIMWRIFYIYYIYIYLPLNDSGATCVFLRWLCPMKEPEAIFIITAIIQILPKNVNIKTNR